jgi:catechol 2,3-dioxygenase-like lactoylglutathione lyase family enzyme
MGDVFVRDEFATGDESPLRHDRPPLPPTKDVAMTDSERPSRINQVGAVFVPVADQDRALAFYVDKLGFEKRSDFAYGGDNRWVEVSPPGAANTIALVPRSEGTPVGGDQTFCAFGTDDIEADHASLRTGGVDVDAEIATKGSRRPGLVSLDVSIGDPIPAQFFFRDVDGNRFLIVQSG